jgi:4-amino-4-deoxy-L-arabinose transferase-like glycosyltransferase
VTSRGASVAVRAALLAGSLVVFGAGLGARDLWNPNEPLYGQAVVEMASSGDLVLPTVNGERFAEKPPLYFWLALGSAGVTGAVGEASLRIPSVLAGLAAVALVYSIVERRAGTRRAAIAATLFATTFSVAWAARTIQMDLLLCATTLAALHAALDMPERAPRWLAPALAGASAGLGALAKGPVGVVCPALVLAVDAVAGGPSRRCLRPRSIAIAGGAALVVAAPWYVAVAMREGPTVLGELVWRQNVTRFLDAWDHQHPWWYYVGALWLEAAPWALFVLVGLGARDPDSGSRTLDRLAWAWLGAIVAFFSLSASKRGAYLLPAMPAVAILASGVVDRAARGVASAARRRAVWILSASVALAVALAAVLAVSRAAVYPGLERPACTMALVCAAGAGLVAWSLVRRDRRPAGPAIALALTLAAAYAVAGAGVLPAINSLKSARGFCEELNLRVGSGAALRSYGSWQWRASYVYYARRRIPRLETDDELRAYFGGPDAVFVLVERGALGDFHRVVGPVEPILGAAIGSNAAFLFTNREATTRADLPDERTTPTGAAATPRGA